MAASGSRNKASATDSDPSTPPQGITLLGFSLLVDTLTRHGGSIEDLATWEVKRDRVLPLTAAKKQTTIEWFLDNLPDDVRAEDVVGTPNVFVSHTYGSRFCGVVAAVRKWAASQTVDALDISSFSISSSSSVAADDRLCFYFDLLVENQHTDGAIIPFETLRDTFGDQVRAIGHTVLVLDGADAAALRRSWCVFEMYTTLAVGARLDIAMPPEAEAEFHNELLHDFDKLEFRTCTVDVAKAEAREAEDKANIDRLMQESEHGFMGVNQLVIGRMQAWMVAQGKAGLEETAAKAAASDDDVEAVVAHTDLQNAVGVLLSSQGKYEEAEAMLRETLERRRRVLGEDHPDTLRSMNNLASVLEGQGKYEKAEATHRETLERIRRVLGEDHPSTLRSMNNLAHVLESQGKYEEAEALHRETLERSRRVLGEDHPDTLTSTNNLAQVLWRQGRHEAEAMHRETLERQRRVLGEDHPDTLTSMNNLASVLESQGRYEEAEVMHRETLERIRRVLGEDHPSTLRSMNDLANVLEGQGKYEEAEAMHRETLERIRRVLGEDHPDTLTSMNNLAYVLWRQGKYEEAEAMLRETLERRRRVLGEDHPDTLTSMSDLASVLESRNKHMETMPRNAE